MKTTLIDFIENNVSKEDILDNSRSDEHRFDIDQLSEDTIQFIKENSRHECVDESYYYVYCLKVYDVKCLITLYKYEFIFETCY